MIRELLRAILRRLRRAERKPGRATYKLNLRPSPQDDRDLLYAILPVHADELPRKVDLREFCPPIKNQGSIGSCGSHAFATAMETVVAANRGKDKVVPLSELFHYYVVRQPEYMNSFPKDSGQYLRDGAKAAADVGISPEKLWPYVYTRYNDKPGSFAYSFARWFKIKAYRRCFGVPDIKTALSQKDPVVFGIKVTQDFVYKVGYDGNSVFTGSPAGGHALCAVGYDEDYQNPNGTKGAVLFANSWGDRWGMRGYGWVSYADLQKHFMEAWAVEIA
jgi:C1A family cysteine protease